MITNVPIFLSNYSNIDIQNVYLSGSISSSIDMYGNLNLLTNDIQLSSSVIAFPLEKKIYNENLINVIYNSTDFSEFINLNVVSSSINISDLQNTINSLTNQLALASSSVVSYQNQYDKFGELNSLNNVQQNLIVNLRIQLGQGSSSADFSTEYPYNPIVIPNVSQ